MVASVCSPKRFLHWKLYCYNSQCKNRLGEHTEATVLPTINYNDYHISTFDTKLLYFPDFMIIQKRTEPHFFADIKFLKKDEYYYALKLK